MGGHGRPIEFTDREYTVSVRDRKMTTRLARLRALSGAQWRVVVVSVVLLAPIQLMLKTSGLKRTAAFLAARSDRPRAVADHETAVSMAEAVSLVAGRRVVGALCLGRSLLLWFLLRRRGMDAELVVGTKAPVDDSWMAHAWVELDSRPSTTPPTCAITTAASVSNCLDSARRRRVRPAGVDSLRSVPADELKSAVLRFGLATSPRCSAHR